MISRLGITEYGLIGISAIFTVGGCVSLLEMGFQSSISKYVAEYNSQNNHVKIAKIICTSMTIFFLIGLILMVGGILLSRAVIDHILKIPRGYHLSFRIALLVIFVSYVFQFPNFVVVGFLSGMQRFDILRRLNCYDGSLLGRRGRIVVPRPSLSVTDHLSNRCVVFAVQFLPVGDIQIRYILAI